MSPPQTLGRIDGHSGHFVATSTDALLHWNMAAHGGVARQTAATGGVFGFDGGQGAAWTGRGGISVAGTKVGERWGWLDVTSTPGATPGAPLGRLPHSALLFFGDLSALSHWKPGQTIDGKADLSFCGRDAPWLAGQGNVPALGADQFGWRDLPMPQAAQWTAWIHQQTAAGAVVEVTSRPHDALYSVEALIQASPIRVGHVALGGGTCLVVDVGQPGEALVVALVDDSGQMVGIRLQWQAAAPARAPGQPLPPDPMTAAKSSLKSAAVSHMESAAQKAMWRKVKGVLPRWAWPLLPDGERDFATRAKDLGQKKLIGMVTGCLFTGCFMLVVFGFLAGLALYIAWTVMQSM